MNDRTPTYGTIPGRTCEICFVYIQGEGPPRCEMHLQDKAEHEAWENFMAVIRNPEVRLEAAQKLVPDIIAWLRRKPEGEITLQRRGLLAMLLDAMSPDAAELEQLREWKAGATGASILLYAPRVGPHTEEAFVAHRDRYMQGSEEYRIGADLIGEAQKAFKKRLESAADQKKLENYQQLVQRLRKLTSSRATLTEELVDSLLENDDE